MSVQATSSSADAVMEAAKTHGVGGQAELAQTILQQTITADTLDSSYATMFASSSISQAPQHQ